MVGSLFGAREETDTTAAIRSPIPQRPLDWPDSRGFVPPPPAPARPPRVPLHGPINSQLGRYDGKDNHLTQSLANYFYFADDARFGGWRTCPQRSDDCIRFGCYQSITEMLAAYGDGGKTRLVLHWPIGRYQR
jgi:hypothetical protein